MKHRSTRSRSWVSPFITGSRRGSWLGWASRRGSVGRCSRSARERIPRVFAPHACFPLFDLRRLRFPLYSEASSPTLEAIPRGRTSSRAAGGHPRTRRDVFVGLFDGSSEKNPDPSSNGAHHFCRTGQIELGTVGRSRSNSARKTTGPTSG